MKTLSILLLTVAMCLSVPEVEAQPQKIGNYDYYELADTDQSLARLDYRYFGNTTSFTVGVWFTKGAQEDSLSKIVVYHALSETALDSLLGIEVSVDSLIYTFTGAEEYKEETITLASGIGYLDFYYDGAATATDTFRLAPKIFIKPK